jgi:hypothetical protein
MLGAWGGISFCLAKQNTRKKKSMADGLPNRHSAPVSVSMAAGG